MDDPSINMFWDSHNFVSEEATSRVSYGGGGGGGEVLESSPPPPQKSWN